MHDLILAATAGLLANPSTRARFDHSKAEHAAKNPKHPHAGKEHPSFGAWVAAEAIDCAKAAADAIKAEG